MRPRLAGALLALPLLAGLLAGLLGGCGDPADGDGIATAGGAATPDTATGDDADDLSEEERYERMLAFAECMREHGVEMADPEPGEGLRIQVRGDPTEVDAAMEVCQELMPGGGQLGEPDPERAERMLAFSRCMRENGFPDFPDPQPDGGLRINPDALGGAEPDDPTFLAAQETCHEQAGLPEPETNRGRGGRA
jgi:hypothetical protein